MWATAVSLSICLIKWHFHIALPEVCLKTVEAFQRDLEKLKAGLSPIT